MGEVFDETSVVVGQAQKLLYFIDRRGRLPIIDSRHFSLLHVQTIGIYGIPKKFTGLEIQCTLFLLESKVVFL